MCLDQAAKLLHVRELLAAVDPEVTGGQDQTTSFHLLFLIVRIAFLLNGHECHIRGISTRHRRLHLRRLPRELRTPQLHHPNKDLGVYSYSPNIVVHSRSSSLHCSVLQHCLVSCLYPICLSLISSLSICILSHSDYYYILTHHHLNVSLISCQI